MTKDNSATGYFFEDLQEGQEADLTRIVTEEDIIKYAEVSGDTNPVQDRKSVV